MFFVKQLSIQQQINNSACIAASACSLLDALGHKPLLQTTLHPLVVQGMGQSLNGFQSLANALVALGSGAVATRYTPTANQLVAWFQQLSSTEQGFLIAHHVKINGQQLAHITVISHDCNGQWFQHDPANATTQTINLAQLVASYAGDVAILA